MNARYFRLLTCLVGALLCSCGGGGSDPTPAQPGFSITASLAPLAVIPGTSIVATVTVSPLNRFAGTVQVAIFNVPAGVTVTPATLSFTITTGSASQQVTVAAGFNAAIQNSSLLLSGTSGSVTASGNINLRVQAPSVTTWHYDNSRSGANQNETVLNLSNVNPNTFGALFTLPVDGAVIGQVLYLSNVTIPGKGMHNVVFAATMHDSVFAFDADNNTGANATPLWQVSLLPAGAMPVPISVQGCGNVTQWTEVGVVSTPVIDPATGTIYVVAKSYENGNSVFRLHALDVTNGSEKFGGPVVITATYNLNGQTNTFSPLAEINRPGLLLTNGHVYLAFGSNGCNAFNDSGWVLSYNAATLVQEGSFNTEPGRALGSIWMRGGGLSADSASNIYAEVAEGSFTAGTNFGSSILKLAQSGTNLHVADWFTPYNQATLSQMDLDLNDAVLLLPDQPGSHPHLALGVGKEGTIYVLDRDNLGQYCLTCINGDTQIVQELVQATGIEPGCFAYWNSLVYSAGTGAPIMAWAVNNGLLSNTPVVQTGTVAGEHSPVITSAATANGILWQINGTNLTAYDATTLAQLYATSQTNGRDTLPPLPHFAQTMVVNGKLYVSTNNSIFVLGLF